MIRLAKEVKKNYDNDNLSNQLKKINDSRAMNHRILSADISIVNYLSDLKSKNYNKNERNNLIRNVIKDKINNI